jgi:hypothetical protein
MQIGSVLFHRPALKEVAYVEATITVTNNTEAVVTIYNLQKFNLEFNLLRNYQLAETDMVSYEIAIDVVDAGLLSTPPGVSKYLPDGDETIVISESSLNEILPGESKGFYVLKNIPVYSAESLRIKAKVKYDTSFITPDYMLEVEKEFEGSLENMKIILDRTYKTQDQLFNRMRECMSSGRPTNGDCSLVRRYKRVLFGRSEIQNHVNLLRKLTPLKLESNEFDQTLPFKDFRSQ